MKSLALDGEVKVIELSDETLRKVYSFFKDDEDEAIIRIDANDVQEIAKKLMKLVKSKKISNPVIVVPLDIRHMLFVILSEFVPDLTVLANEEMVSDYNIKFIGKV